MNKKNEIVDKLSLIQDYMMFYAHANEALDASDSHGHPGVAAVGELIAEQVASVAAEVQQLD